MTVVDSCGWVDFFVDGSRAARYARYLKSGTAVIVPTVTIYEVYKKIKRDSGEENALVAVARMKQGTLAPLSDEIALRAADLGLEHGLPMADAIVYATARLCGAAVATHDPHFKDLEGVTFVE